MFVDMYKAGGQWARSDSEKIIKIVATKEEKDSFVAGATKVITGDGERYNGFKNHVLNDWKTYAPYTDEEKEAFKDRPAYILKLYERDFVNMAVFWFWLCSYFESISLT